MQLVAGKMTYCVTNCEKEPCFRRVSEISSKMQNRMWMDKWTRSIHDEGVSQEIF